MMADSTFRALLVDAVADRTHVSFRELSDDDLPQGNVVVDVAYSSLNYKDGLAVTGAGKVVRSFPMVPGVDLAGTVRQSDVPEYAPGDRVLVTGYGLGEQHWGGYAGRARVDAGWLVPVPDGLTLRRAMAIGTAGFTAMLGVMALEWHGCDPDAGEVVVTGASGGVGSIAVAILANLGYTVAASTGREALHDYLRDLGASEIIAREALAREARPMEKGRWAGAIDAVGGQTLATLIATMATWGSIASIGLAGGAELHTTVYPFILRGVNLLGIDSVTAPQPLRREAWARLVTDLPLDKLDGLTREATLDEVPELAGKIVNGEIHGRVVVNVAG